MAVEKMLKLRGDVCKSQKASLGLRVSPVIFMSHVALHWLLPVASNSAGCSDISIHRFSSTDPKKVSTTVH